MNIKAFGICAIVVVLTGCASNSVPPTGDESIVHVNARIGDEIIARRLDAKTVDNLRNFTLTGAEHTMEIGIVITGHRDNYRRCLATISYDRFEPGVHYTLTQSNVVRGDVAVSLIDANGKTLARTDNIPCI